MTSLGCGCAWAASRRSLIQTGWLFLLFGSLLVSSSNFSPPPPKSHVPASPRENSSSISPLSFPNQFPLFPRLLRHLLEEPQTRVIILSSSKATRAETCFFRSSSSAHFFFFFFFFFLSLEGAPMDGVYSETLLRVSLHLVGHTRSCRGVFYFPPALPHFFFSSHLLISRDFSPSPPSATTRISSPQVARKTIRPPSLAQRDRLRIPTEGSDPFPFPGPDILIHPKDGGVDDSSSWITLWVLKDGALPLSVVTSFLSIVRFLSSAFFFFLFRALLL